MGLPPNKALQLTGRRFGACRGSQPPAARFGVDSAGGRRSWHSGPRRPAAERRSVRRQHEVPSPVWDAIIDFVLGGGFTTRLGVDPLDFFVGCGCFSVFFAVPFLALGVPSGDWVHPVLYASAAFGAFGSFGCLRVDADGRVARILIGLGLGLTGCVASLLALRTG